MGLHIHVLNDVKEFFEGLSQDAAAKIYAHLQLFQENHTEGLVIKSLKGKIKELIVKQYRIVFFTISNTGYIVDAFRKQSRKTPKRIIERAEEIYRVISGI